MNARKLKQPVVGSGKTFTEEDYAYLGRMMADAYEHARRRGGAAAGDSVKPPSADRTAFDSSDLLDFLGRLENEFERREEHWRSATGDPYGIAQGLMVAMAEIKESLRTVIGEVVARKSTAEVRHGAKDADQN